MQISNQGKMVRRALVILAIFFLFVGLVCAWPFSSKAENGKEIERGPLPPPVVQSPADGAQYGGKILECKWLKVEGAAKYHLEVAEDHEFTLLQDDRKDIKGDAYILYNYGFKAYYFRICSVDEKDREGEWSDKMKFNMMPPSR
jgi:hypothetical protein